MLYWLIPLIIGVILFAAFMYFRVREQRIVAVILKGFTSLMFIATAVVAWQTSKNPNHMFGLFVIIGLVFGLAGDVLLDIKYMTQNKEHLFTVLGFLAFAACHACFTSGMFIYFFNFNASPFYLIIPALVTALLVVITLLMEKFTMIRYKDMKPYVILYGIFLFFTVCIYMSICIQTAWSNPVLFIMFGGLIAFALSDLILNNTYFASGFNTPAFIISNHVLYYVGQFAIAVALFFLI